MTTPLPPTTTIRRDLRFAIGCLLLAFLVLLVRSSFWQGMLIPVRVSGGSMAETYLGEHVNIRCSRCQLPFRVDLGPWQSRSQSICPNCQQSLDETHAVSQASGQRVLIDRAAYYFSSPARFEVIAFREPKTNDLAMKRVIALPHERWEFCHGDLFVNDQLIRKTLPQCLASAVLVHDDRYRESSENSRWQAADLNTNWQITATGFAWSKQQVETTGQSRGVDWLVYHHASSHPAAKAKDACVKDLDPYNSTLARPLQNVTDLIVQGEFQLAELGVIHFRIHDGYEHHEMHYSAKKNAVDKTKSFLFGLCDRTLWLQVDGTTIIERKELAWRDNPPQCISQPLAIGGAGEGCIIKNLRISRDIHYLAPNGLSDTWNLEISPYDDEYILLGDNPSLSIDSRHWGSIARDRILGRVLNWSGRIQEKEPLINAHVR